MNADNSAERQQDKAELRRELELTPNVVRERISPLEPSIIDVESLEPLAVSEKTYEDQITFENVLVRDSLQAVIGAGPDGDMIGVVHRSAEKKETLLFIKYDGVENFNNIEKRITVGGQDSPTVIGRGSPEILNDEHTAEVQMTLQRLDGPTKFLILDGDNDETSASDDGTFLYYKQKRQPVKPDKPPRQAAVEKALPEEVSTIAELVPEAAPSGDPEPPTKVAEVELELPTQEEPELVRGDGTPPASPERKIKKKPIKRYFDSDRRAWIEGRFVSGIDDPQYGPAVIELKDGSQISIRQGKDADKKPKKKANDKNKPAKPATTPEASTGPTSAETSPYDIAAAEQGYREDYRKFISEQKIVKTGEGIEGFDGYDYDNHGYIAFPKESDWLGLVLSDLENVAEKFRNGGMTEEQAEDRMDDVIFKREFISVLSSGYEDFYASKHLLLDKNISDSEFEALLKKLYEKLASDDEDSSVE
jgi:hypothetical protein